MKKKYIICVIVAIGILMVATYFFKSNKNEYFKNNFAKWDNGEFTESEGFEFFEDFQEYLFKNSGITDEDIWKISERLNVLEYDGVRIIEYIENPEKYGSSARLSYHIVQYNEFIIPMNYGGSFHIYDIAKTDDNILYIYGYDYKFSNETGLTIFKAIPKENSLDIAKNTILLETDSSKLQLVDNSLYYGGNHINIKEIDKKSLVITIEILNDNLKFYLNLNDDGVYYIE